MTAGSPSAHAVSFLFRLCTLTVTRLQVKQSLEPSLPSLVVAVSMKTPHRFLRSNELPLPASGTLDISLQLTFSLQVFRHRVQIMVECYTHISSAVPPFP